MISERLLQFIWQFQYYNRNELTTTEGEELEVIYQGQYNSNQGPDFTAGRIKLAKRTWIGNIELHVNSSDWHKHLHENDSNYNNIILHVVWNDDYAAGKWRFPTLILSDRVPKILLDQYEAWMKCSSFIACENAASSVGELVSTNWTERLVIERLERKAAYVIGLLTGNNFHWREVMWRMMARNFGLYVNSDAFGDVAASIPFNVILKCRHQVHRLEALLLGQAGLLEEDFNDKYAMMLKKEYLFLQRKYGLQKIDTPVSFLRMRPACFPTVRLAQLAMFFHTSGDLPGTTPGSFPITAIKKQLVDVTANDYWHYRFRFDEESEYRPKKVGEEMATNILINTYIPLVYTYGKYHKVKHYQEKAIEWLGQLQAENNSIIKRFRKIGMVVRNAGDSQSLMEMKSQYCDKRKCLDCAIGNAVLKRKI